MIRYENITATRLNEDTKQKLSAIAKHLNSNESEVVRHLVVEFVQRPDYENVSLTKPIK